MVIRQSPMHKFSQFADWSIRKLDNLVEQMIYGQVNLRTANF